MHALRDVAPYLDLGWRIAMAVVLTVGGGVWLDQWLGTLPAFTLGGILLGLASAAVQITRLNRPASNREEEARDDPSPSTGDGDQPGKTP